MNRNVVLGFVALSVAMLCLVGAVRANEAQPKQYYGFGVSPRGVAMTDFGMGYEVGAVDCGGPARAAGIQRGDILVNITVKEMAIKYKELSSTSRTMEPIAISNVSMIRWVRVAKVDVVRNGKIAERDIILMFDQITGKSC